MIQIISNISLKTLTAVHPVTVTLLRKFSETVNSTIDVKEVSNFNTKVEHWWDEQGELKPLHSLNKVRIPFIRDGLKNRGLLHLDFKDSATPLKNINIIDVGCGGGILCEPLAKLGANVTGIDASSDLIKCAETHANENPELKNPITYINDSLENQTENYKNYFDAVVSSECVEHVACKETFLKSCVDVLKPNGSIFITTINKTTLSWLFGIIGAEYLFNIVPKGTHDWEKFIPPREIQKILENNNCQTRMIHGIMYNPCNDNWSWVPRSDINYAIHAVKHL